VIVASDLRIRRFTPMAERVLNLIPPTSPADQPHQAEHRLPELSS